MRFLFLLLGLAFNSGSFADNITYSSFKVNNFINSCNKNECVSHLVISFNDIHHVVDHPQILNCDIKVLTNECEDNKCDLMIRTSNNHETINVLTFDGETAQILDYAFQKPSYYL